MAKERQKIYLGSVTVAAATESFLSALKDAGWQGAAEEIAAEAALGRVTAAGVPARISAPHYDAAAMDGVAVAAADTYAATETRPVRLTRTQATWVDTGDPIPAGKDCVIMVEDINRIDDQVEIYAAATPWQHVRSIGEDLVATELVIPAGTEIRPPEIGALLAAGVDRVSVWKRPRVAFIPTGTELVQPGPEPQAGEIIEFNSRVVLAMADEWGAVTNRYPIVEDNYDRLRAAVGAAVAESDIVIVNAGSSAGSEDFTVHVLAELGRVLVHGVAVRPGKPVILAVVNGKPVIGLPGYPVSTWLMADLFLKPLVYSFRGLAAPERKRITARLTRRLASTMGVADYVRVKLGQVGGQMVATPISRGAGVISSLVRADGLMVVPPSLEGYEEGKGVEVELLRPVTEVQSAVVASGSHDIVLDLISSYLRRQGGPTLSSAHVGSLAGLTALRRGEAHLAGVHLLDPDTGEYNSSYVRRYLARPAKLVLLCGRDQGFLLPPGNPKTICSFTDLARPDITFVNRQRGAGTRLLLDYRLQQAGVKPGQVQGYRREEFTHLGVAAAVKAGSADCGLGILAAARALGLDFAPITREEYELCIPDEHWDHPGIQALIALLQQPEFRAEVEALGGYDMSEAGRIRAVAG